MASPRSSSFSPFILKKRSPYRKNEIFLHDYYNFTVISQLDGRRGSRAKTNMVRNEPLFYPDAMFLVLLPLTHINWHFLELDTDRKPRQSPMYFLLHNENKPPFVSISLLAHGETSPVSQLKLASI